MPQYTIEKANGGFVCIEAKDKKAADKRAKDEFDGKVVHSGSDHGDNENHPNLVRDKKLAEARKEFAKGKKKEEANDEEE